MIVDIEPGANVFNNEDPTNPFGNVDGFLGDNGARTHLVVQVYGADETIEIPAPRVRLSDAREVHIDGDGEYVQELLRAQRARSDDETQPFNGGASGASLGNGLLRPVPPSSSEPTEDLDGLTRPSPDDAPLTQPAAEPAALEATTSSDVIRMGVVGGTSSGKTTYLGALTLASLRNTSGQWRVEPWAERAESRELLQSYTKTLRDKKFSAATNDRPKIGCIITPRSVVIRSRLLARFLNHRPILGMLDRIGFHRKPSFILDSRDYPGGDIESLQEGEELWGYLAGCDGIVYFFDPTLRDTEPTSNFDYIKRTLDMLLLKAQQNDTLQDGSLPHYLAVCVTKFDAPEVFEALRENGRYTDPPTNTPDGSQAKRCFDFLAGDLVYGQIEGAFNSDRVEHFLTSSIGFLTDENGKVDPDYYGNVIYTAQGGKSILGEVVPINVLEPLVWIQERVMKDRRAAAKAVKDPK